MSANTANRAYTYPSSTDNYRPHTDIQELANDVDADVQLIHDAWTAYTPVFTAAAGSPALGNATVMGRYKQVGKTVHLAIRIVWGGTSNFGGAGWRFSLPVTARSSEALNRVGAAKCRDVSAASAGHFPAICEIETTDPTTVTLFNVNQQVGNLFPFTWVSTDFIELGITYEAA